MAAITPNMAIGSYLATYGAVPLGLVEGPYNMQVQHLATPIRTDYHGDMDVDAIDRGQNWFATLIVKEWTATVRKAFFPFGLDNASFASADALLGQPGNLLATTKLPAGRLYTGLAQVLALTPYTNTQAQTISTKTVYTATFAILRPNSVVNIPLGNVERNIPIEFQFFPDNDGGQIKHLVASDA